tara:strand:+ start:181 stop:285 length:105 start_codon:yes stop_codon:yes gene_type:complete
MGNTKLKPPAPNSLSGLSDSRNGFSLKKRKPKRR